MAKVGVRVDEGEDGRPHGHAMFTGESVDASTPHVEGPITSISLSTEAFTRRAAGRRSVDDTTYTLQQRRRGRRPPRARRGDHHALSAAGGPPAGCLHRRPLPTCLRASCTRSPG